MSRLPSEQVLTPASPLGALELFLRARIERARELDAAGDRGASAVEWVIITGVLVAIAVGLGTFLLREVREKENDINLDTPAY